MPKKTDGTDHNSALMVGRETVGHRIAAFVDGLTEKYGLTLAQRMFLMMRWRFRTDAECARTLGFKARTVERWKEKQSYNDGRRISDFSTAYEEFFRGFDGIIQGEIEGLLGKVVGRVDEMLDAEKKWIGAGGVEQSAPDHETRFKGIQAVLHYLGRWGARNPVEVTMNTVNASEEFAKLLQQKRIERARTVEGDFKVTDDN